MTKGSLVHRVLELLFTHPAPSRTIERARDCFRQAIDEYSIDPEYTLLNLDETQQEAFNDDAWSLVEAYFRMEDPTTIREIGLEIRLEAQVGSLALRGIIDRLELDADGGLVRDVKARRDYEILGPHDSGASAVTASHVNRRYRSSSDRCGEGLIEGLENVECWLRHETLLLEHPDAG